MKGERTCCFSAKNRELSRSLRLQKALVGVFACAWASSMAADRLQSLLPELMHQGWFWWVKKWVDSRVCHPDYDNPFLLYHIFNICRNSFFSPLSLPLHQLCSLMELIRNRVEAGFICLNCVFTSELASSSENNLSHPQDDNLFKWATQ